MKNLTHGCKNFQLIDAAPAIHDRCKVDSMRVRDEIITFRVPVYNISTYYDLMSIKRVFFFFVMYSLNSLSGVDNGVESSQ